MRSVLICAAALGALSGCAAPAASTADPEVITSARAVSLARVRCLLVAPFENASDDPLAADAAVGAVVSAIDQERTAVLPIQELRALFERTSLELPEGVAPSLALELAEILGADAALYGAVEGRSRGNDPGLMVTLRLAAAGTRDVLFARVAPVVPRDGEPLSRAVQRTVLEASGPMLERIGVPGRKACFDRQRTDRLRLLAAAAEQRGAPMAPAAAPSPPPAPVAAAVTPPASPPRSAGPAAVPAARPSPAPAAAAPPPRGAPPAAPGRGAGGEPAEARPVPVLTARQADWAATLGARERLLVADVAFIGRSPRLEREAGLADLAAVLGVSASLRIRIEGFVDASSDPADDLRASREMACAAKRRLAELGVAAERMTCAGRGHEDPLVPNFTYRGRATNRRIEVVAVE